MIISVPVWGDWYHRMFRTYTWPAISAALRHAKAKPRIVVHTDRPADIIETVPIEIPDVRPLPTGESHYQVFGKCHAEALALAELGETVILLNADTIVSREMIAVIAKHFDGGKSLLMCAGTRVLEAQDCPIGKPAAVLAAFGVRQFHPMLYDTVWPARATSSSGLHFREGGGLVLRAFHLHPLACRKDRPLQPGVTIDAGLADNYAEHEIHVVTDRTEFAMVSMTQDDRRFKVHPRADVADVLHWAKRAHPRHWWFLKHRIVLAGDGAEGPVERDIMGKVLAGH
jgi:hypothetical protein